MVAGAEGFCVVLFNFTFFLKEGISKEEEVENIGSVILDDSWSQQRWK